MSRLEQDKLFSSSARWIWADCKAGDAWLMFRRSVKLPADCRVSRLRITASFNYLLYVAPQGTGLGCRVSASSSSSSSISRFEDEDDDERLALPIASRPHQSPSVYGKTLHAR